jgi:hypothetical protein
LALAASSSEILRLMTRNSVTIWVSGVLFVSTPMVGPKPHKHHRLYALTSVAAERGRHDAAPSATVTTARLQKSRQAQAINTGIVKLRRTLSPCKGS